MFVQPGSSSRLNRLRVWPERADDSAGIEADAVNGLIIDSARGVASESYARLEVNP